jgi:hypothetical protein
LPDASAQSVGGSGTVWACAVVTANSISGITASNDNALPAYRLQESFPSPEIQFNLLAAFSISIDITTPILKVARGSDLRLEIIVVVFRSKCELDHG